MRDTKMLISRRTRSTVTVSAALIALCLSSTASAQDDDFTTVIQQAREAFTARDFITSIGFLSQAYELDRSEINILFNIGRAYQEYGRCDTALDYFDQFLAVSPADNGALERLSDERPVVLSCSQDYNDVMDSANEALYGDRASEAAALFQEAIGISNEPVARILRAESLVEAGRCEEARDYAASISGDEDLSEAEVIQIEGSRDQAIDCIAAREREVCVVDCDGRNDERWANAAGGGDSQELIGLIVGGTGGALLLGAIIHDATSQGTIDDFEAAAERGDSAQFESLKDDIDSGKTLSLILYGAGIVALGTGAVLYFTAGGESDPEGLEDCDGICWDFGIGGPGDAGVWLGGEF